jgi:prolyl oligopeptidase
LVNTNYKAPKYRVVAYDLTNPGVGNFTEVIPESENTLEGVSYCGNKLFVQYMEDAKSKISIFSSRGTPEGEVEIIEEYADIYAFVFYHTGIEVE